MPYTPAAPLPASASASPTAPLPPPAPTPSQHSAPATTPSTPALSDIAGAAHTHAHPFAPLHHSTVTSTQPKAPPTERRRSTLTSRFPLLRKGSREIASPHAAIPSIHLRSGSAYIRLPSAAHNPFSSTGEPRASTSSSRGRIERPSEELRRRDPSSTPSNPFADPDVLSDSTSIHSATPQGPSFVEPATDLDSERGHVKLEPSRSLSKATRVPDKKMHQTSSRLLRMTDDERPFTNDFKDLFATLVVSLPLSAHRVRFRMIDHTFTSDEAITNLGSLKFSQSNRMPDPKDSSRVVTTTTTTTFSMAKEMARSVCQKFLEAKFIESVESKIDFQNKSSVWQLTPKGIHILERFCSRNGIQSMHVKSVIDSNRNPHQLVVLERDNDTDKLHHDEGTVEIIFRRFVGASVNEVATTDSDSVHEFSRSDIGVRMMKHKPTPTRPYDHVFSGKATVDWLMDCCTMVDRRESLEVGGLFLELGLIAHVDQRNEKTGFIPAKQAHYYITPHGEQVAGWSLADDTSLNTDAGAAKIRDGAARDSNSNRTNIIIKHPSWRLLYREFLKETMCEENLSFYLEVQQFNNQYKAAVNTTGDSRVETIRETLAAAYGLYNAFLAPGSPNELNIDHALRTQLATRMTRAVGDDAAMMQSLIEVAQLFEKAQNSIFKLMSSDSVPKFIKHPKYASQLRGLDAAAAAQYAAQSSASTRS